LLDYDVLAEIRHRFASRGYPMTPNNERQALIPTGATVLPNPNGTAPGIKMNHDGKLIVLLPGPPREMKPMFDDYVWSDLEKMSRGTRISTRTLKVTGLGESAMDDLIAPVYRQYSNPATTILFTDSDLEIHLTARAETSERAESLADELAEKLADKLGNYLYSANGESMEEVVGNRLALKRYTLATAESCTGGLVAERITRVPGSSEYFLGGIVSYAETAKSALLGVPKQLIESRGVVSGDVSEAMGRGAKDRFGSTIGLGITGVAGPAGGPQETPVGTVYVGIADDVGSSNRRMILPGDRHLIRWRASQAALEIVRRRYLL